MTCGFGAIAHTERTNECGHVDFRCGLGDAQGARDFLIGFAMRQKNGYEGQDLSCKAISGVTRSPPFLQVRYRCTGEGNYTTNVRWRLIGLRLVWNSRVPR